MGNIQDKVASISISFMDGGKDKNKYRLIKTYQNYIEVAKQQGQDENTIFQAISKEANNDESELANVIFNLGLSWPSNKSDVLSDNGFFNSLTEEQAIELSKAMEPYLPKFTMPAEGQA